jgi:transposase
MDDLLAVIPAHEGVDFCPFSGQRLKTVDYLSNNEIICSINIRSTVISPYPSRRQNGDDMGKKRNLPESEQSSFSFFESMPEGQGRPGREDTETPPNFHNPDPEHIFVGEVSLREYLHQNEFGWVVRLRELISESDWSPFMGAYTGRGRRALHPSILVGLIVYGMLESRWSLRDLEKLALRDVGAWWICGGMQPDHSTIGTFINLHAHVLSEQYFVELTKRLVGSLKLSATQVAGDGTVTEAYGSRFKTLKAEALRQVAEEAQEKARQNPEDAQAASKAEQAERAAHLAEQRQQNAEDKGRKEHSIKVCLTEPDAMVQPLKSKARRPSYKPSVLANKDRFIVGQGLDPSSETAMVRPMLGQHERIFGTLPAGLCLDAGYNNFQILAMAVDLDLDVLVPADKEEDGVQTKRPLAEQTFSKRDFQYDEKTDSYICPAGYGLNKRGGVQVQKGRKLQKYQCNLPEPCPYRRQCTRSKYGRTIIRYEDEPLKEAMRTVLEHPKARAKCAERKWMVEPVFSVLRDGQGLRKFHRRGLKKVKIEFALHCVAYNLGRTLRLERRRNVKFLLLHLPEHSHVLP